MIIDSINSLITFINIRYTRSACHIIAWKSDDISLWNVESGLLKIVDIGCTRYELFQTMLSHLHGINDNGRLNVVVNCKSSLSPIKVGMNLLYIFFFFLLKPIPYRVYITSIGVIYYREHIKHVGDITKLTLPYR